MLPSIIAQRSEKIKLKKPENSWESSSSKSTSVAPKLLVVYPNKFNKKACKNVLVSRIMKAKHPLCQRKSVLYKILEKWLRWKRTCLGSIQTLTIYLFKSTVFSTLIAHSTTSGTIIRIEISSTSKLTSHQ